MSISFPPTTATGASAWPSTGSSGSAGSWPGSDSSGSSGSWPGAGSSGGPGSWSGSTGDYAAFASPTIDLEAMRIAHACLASACVLFFFPFGGCIIRLVDIDKHRHIVWFHAGVQMFAYTIFLAAAGLGIWMAHTFGVMGGNVTQYVRPTFFKGREDESSH
jgi:hypothetical protein